VIDYLGFLAGFLTAIAQLPQVVKVVRSRDTHSISLWTYLILSFGILLWLIYGFLIGDYPLIVANSTTLLFTAIIVNYKLRYK
jgi:MtN3 and saliva related transmembrane protein